MRVTIDLPDEILRGVRRLAHDQKLELPETIVGLLRQQVQALPELPSEADREWVVDGLSQSDIDDILAHAEEESHGLYR